MPSNKKKIKTQPSESNVNHEIIEVNQNGNENNFILLVLHKVANSSVTMTCVVILHLFAMSQMSEHVAAMKKYGGTPDALFAYKPSQLQHWLESVGVDGCSAYQKMAAWDLFPFMESYTLLLGGLLVQQAKISGVNEKIALIFPFVMICDVIETILPAKGCRNGKLTAVELSIASEANKFKWVCLGIGILCLTCLFLYNALFPLKASNNRDNKTK